MKSALNAACSFCQVAPGEPCVGASGYPQSTPHAGRGQSRFAVRRKRLAKKIKEGNIREALDARVKAYGGETRAVSWLGRKNAPDVLCLFPVGSPAAGWSPAFVEAKRPKKTATEAQAREHERMREAGCVVLVVTTIEELDKWLPPL